MFQNIKKKKLILENRRPYSREVLDYLEKVNYLDWISSAMRLDGSSLNRENIKKLLQGEFIATATIKEHDMVDGYYNAIKIAYDMVHMRQNINKDTIVKLYILISKNQICRYRETSPVIFTFSYNPPHPSDIEEQMAALIRWINSSDLETLPIQKAVYLHNKFIEIYPFEQECEAMARFLMQYYLLLQGFPPINLLLNETEYNELIISYLKNREIDVFSGAVERAVFNKLDLMMQLTSET